MEIWEEVRIDASELENGKGASNPCSKTRESERKRGETYSIRSFAESIFLLTSTEAAKPESGTVGLLLWSEAGCSGTTKHRGPSHSTDGWPDGGRNSAVAS